MRRGNCRAATVFGRDATRIDTILALGRLFSYGLLCLFSSSVAAESEIPAVDCIISPSQIVDLSSPVAGVIEALLVERSDVVTAGEVVAQLEAGVERATVELAKARTRIDPQMQTEKVNLDFDNRRKERIDSLYGRQVIPINNKEEADRDVELSRWKLEQVKDLQEIRRLELLRARELLEQKTIRATIDGFVIERFKSVGEYVEDQPIVRLARMDPLKIEAILPIRHFGLITPGMTAEIQPETLQGEIRLARVTVVDRMGDAASGTFAVTLEMDNPDYIIPAGLKCDLRFDSVRQDIARSEPAPTRSEARPTAARPTAARPTAARPNAARPTAAVPTQPVQNAAVSDVSDSKEVATSDELPAVLPADKEAATPSKISQAVPFSHYILGPFDDESAAADARDLLGDVEVTLRGEFIEEVVSYLVVTPALSEDGRQRVKESLNNAGIRDLVLLRSPPYAGRFALGVYTKRKRAEARSAALAEIGVASELNERTRTTPRWWLDAKMPGDKVEHLLLTLDSEGVTYQPAEFQQFGQRRE